MNESLDISEIRDPLIRYFSSIKGRFIWVGFAGLLLVLWLIFGGIVEIFVPVGVIKPEISYDPWWKPSELLMGINMMVIFYPIMLTQYVRTPVKVILSIVKLEDKRVINKDFENKKLSDKIIANLNSRIIWAFAFLFAIAYAIIYRNIIIDWQLSQGMNTFWFISPFYKWAVVMIYSIGTFFVFVFLIRLFIIPTIISSHIYNLKDNFCLLPHHPDKCSGLGAIGEIFWNITSVLIVSTCWVISTLVFYPLLAGGKPNLALLMVFPSIYVIFVVWVFWWLIWRTHIAMKHQKQEILLPLSERLYRIHNYKNKKSILYHSDSVLLAFTKEYETVTALINLIDKSIEVWPFALNKSPLPALTTLSPVIGSVILYFLEDVIISTLNVFTSNITSLW